MPVNWEEFYVIQVNSFLEKLTFFVNTPNEVELDAIMKIELGKYYNLLVSDLQSDMFFMGTYNK
jgi:hypothetical protein